MREYEATIVLSGQLDEEGVNELIGQMGDVLARHEGSVTSVGQLIDRKGNVVEDVEEWKPRKLAYTIKGEREGYYVVLRLQAPTGAPSELERWMTINERVLRFLVLRTDED